MPTYRTIGTCSREIIFSVDKDNVVTSVKYIGGCSGNLQGICKLVVGKKAEDVISLLKGIRCRGNTSCPDQLARALEQYLQKGGNECVSDDDIL